MENKDWTDQEPLAQGLDALPEESFRFPQSSGELRMTVLNQTSKVVRARARRRRLIQVALVAAAYLGGITTAFLVTERSIVDREGREMVQESPSQSYVDSVCTVNVVPAGVVYERNGCRNVALTSGLSPSPAKDQM